LGNGREIARYGLSGVVSDCEQRRSAGRRVAISPEGIRFYVISMTGDPTLTWTPAERLTATKMTAR
jgi:hypothetical protein